MNIDLLPPELDVTPDLNLKIRIRVLSKVLYELTNVCGANCSDDIERGILNKQIINKITISFFDVEDVIRGQIIFLIDWDKLEFSAKTNQDVTLLKSIDINRLVAPQLDPELYNILKVHVDKLKTKYHIERVQLYFDYRTQYKKDKKVYENTMAYLHHTDKYETPKKSINSLSYELQTAFQGLDGCLDVIFRT